MRIVTSLVTRAIAVASVLATALATASCGGGQGPEFDPVGDQIAQVGVELRVELVATDPNGDRLDFGFHGDDPRIDQAATIARTPSGVGVFRWTPLAADVGAHYVDFTASDGAHTTTTTVLIDVRSAIGGASAPVFRQPLGTGTTLDLSVRQCLDISVVVDDQDSATVDIAQEEPLIEGALLQPGAGLTAAWNWCPSPAQIAAQDRYTLALSANDGDNPKTIKNYLIVLRAPNRECPGAAPVIAHTPTDATTINNLTVDATITDDLDLKRPPLFYYAATPPASPPDLGAMTQLSMLLIDGDMKHGVWAADVPNPVATLPTGATAHLYYVIVADDDDDPMGTCDHTTQAPATGTYAMQVTNPGGTGTAGLCDACTADVQCGGGGNLCARVGAANDSFCLKACAGPADCATGFTCSATAITSVDGTAGKQCVPDTGSCTGGGTCHDDAHEDDDSRTQVATAAGLAIGTFSGTSCPLPGGQDDDEDWFPIVITADASITLTLTGGAATDLDLGLYASDGTPVISSTGLTSTETVTTCLTAGRYYARVYSWGQAENPYTLAYSKTAQSCAATCTDDSHEPDDSALQARATTYPTTTSTGNMICAGDDDWYEVLLFDADKLVVDLTFAQATSSEDLDLHLINPAGTDLTPCTEANPATCTVAHGQSADANEHLEWTIASGCASGCYYDVVVRGWDGATNHYDIKIDIQ
jgi:hypothetical protein